MGINRVTKRGKGRIEVRKRWPDGTTFRRYFPNMTVAKNVNARIEEAVVTGKWQSLKRDLSGEQKREMTVADFAKVYLRDYCRVRNKDVAFKECAIRHLVEVLGDIPLKSFTRKHAHQYAAVRGRQVAPATVNRHLAVLKNLFTFALEREYVTVHPLARFRLLPEEKRALQVMTLDEERRLVEEVARLDHTVGAYVAVLGETGLRKQEGLSLQWGQIDLSQRLLSVDRTKSKKPRYIPLSDFALEWIKSLVRLMGCPYLFVNLKTRQRLKDPRGPFDKGKQAAGLEWVTIHDLRHFRATQWVRSGVDLRTVKELLGHSAIQTTMRYAHFSPAAFEAVRKAQQRETRGRHLGDTLQGERPIGVGRIALNH